MRVRPKSGTMSAASRLARKNGLVVSHRERMRAKDWVVGFLHTINDSLSAHELFMASEAFGMGFRYNLIQVACTNLDQQNFIHSIDEFGTGESGQPAARYMLSAQVHANPDPAIYRREFEPAPYTSDVKRAIKLYERTGDGGIDVVAHQRERRALIAAAYTAQEKRRNED